MTDPEFTLPDFDLREPSYDEFHHSLKNNNIEVADNDEHLGFIGFFYNGYYSSFTRSEKIYARIPLFFYEDDELTDRATFDSVFSKFQDAIVKLKGNPVESGKHVFEHRDSNHYYLYSIWQLTYCRLALLQDEYDIQFGLDISLHFIYQSGNASELLFNEEMSG